MKSDQWRDIFLIFYSIIIIASFGFAISSGLSATLGDEARTLAPIEQRLSFTFGLTVLAAVLNAIIAWLIFDYLDTKENNQKRYNR